MTGIVMPECRHDIYNTLQRAATARTRWHDEAPPITGRSLVAMYTPGKTPATGYPLRSIQPLNGMHSVSKRNATGYRMQNDGYPNTDDSISGIVKQKNIPEGIRRISKNKELSPSGNYHTHLSGNTLHTSGNMIFNLQHKFRRLISQATCTRYFPEPHRIVFRQWRQIAS